MWPSCWTPAPGCRATPLARRSGTPAPRPTATIAGEYNIGLLYESGEGVQRNPDLARFWLGRAAEALPAAAERLAALGPARPEERRLAPPELLAAGIVGDGDGDRAELVWSAGPGPPDARFLVELARLPAGNETWGAILVSRSTEASALAERLRHEDADYAWRVTLRGRAGGHYAASPWQLVGNAARPDAPAGLPEGRITLRVAPDDAPAHRLARELTASFWDAGLWVRVLPDGDASTESGVRYGFAEDATPCRDGRRVPARPAPGRRRPVARPGCRAGGDRGAVGRRAGRDPRSDRSGYGAAIEQQPVNSRGSPGSSRISMISSP